MDTVRADQFQGNRDRIKAVATFIVIAVLFYLVQLVSRENAWFFSNWYVSDGETLADVVSHLTTGHVSIFDIDIGQGVYITYFLPGLIGEGAYFLVNVLLLAAVGWFVGYKSIYLFPYFLVALALPSKDILVLVVVLASILLMFNDRSLLALLIITLSYFFRDGCFFVLLTIFVAYHVLRRRYVRPATLVIGAFLVGALFFELMLDVFGGLDIVKRNYHVYKSNAHSFLGIGSAFDYFIRVFGNATNLAFRPALVDDHGGISVLAVSYFVSGISMLVALAYSIRTVVHHQDENLTTYLSVFFLVSLAVISLNPHIQGRYQFPIGVILLGHMIGNMPPRQILKIYFVTMLVAIVAFLAYHFSAIPSPPPPMANSLHMKVLPGNT